MASGTVKWFNEAKGFVITQTDGGDDVFVPAPRSRRRLQDARRGESLFDGGPKGLRAANVRKAKAPRYHLRDEGGVPRTPPLFPTRQWLRVASPPTCAAAPRSSCRRAGAVTGKVEAFTVASVPLRGRCLRLTT